MIDDAGNIRAGRSTFIYEDQPRLAAWLEGMIPGVKLRDDAKCIGHERGGRLVSVVGFDTFAQNDCMVTLASDGSRRWMTRDFAAVSLAFPFLQCGFSRISSLVSEHNTAAMRYDLKFGWRLEGRLRKAGAMGEDLFLLGMLREECRWILNDAGFEEVPAL